MFIEPSAAAQPAIEAALPANPPMTIFEMFRRLSLDMGQPKIVLKVPGPVELDGIKKDAITLAVPWCVIEDAGRTQIAPGTVTCLALGPAPEEHIDRLTGDLKLL